VRELFGLRDDEPTESVDRAEEQARIAPAQLAEVHDLQRRRQG
jgi:hypothetical protein